MWFLVENSYVCLLNGLGTPGGRQDQEDFHSSLLSLQLFLVLKNLVVCTQVNVFQRNSMTNLKNVWDLPKPWTSLWSPSDSAVMPTSQQCRLSRWQNFDLWRNLALTLKCCGLHLWHGNLIQMGWDPYLYYSFHRSNLIVALPGTHALPGSLIWEINMVGQNKLLFMH